MNSYVPPPTALETTCYGNSFVPLPISGFHREAGMQGGLPSQGNLKFQHRRQILILTGLSLPAIFHVSLIGTQTMVARPPRLIGSPALAGRVLNVRKNKISSFVQTLYKEASLGPCPIPPHEP